MRIVVHSNGPAARTGYGVQCGLLLRMLRDLGHEICCSAYYGQSDEASTYDGIPVFRCQSRRLGGPDIGVDYGIEVLPHIAKMWRADLVITLLDSWVLDPDLLARLNIIHWTPIDTWPLGLLDKAGLERSGAFPVAMTRHGYNAIIMEGFKPAYIPHAFDPEIFYPDEERRTAARAKKGIEGKFVIGINAANKDVVRKCWPEQIVAYSRLWKNYPGKVLLRANVKANDQVSIPMVAKRCDLPEEAIEYTMPGLLDEEGMADWYRSLDVLSACSAGEGFCLPLIEAPACGTPVITTNAGPMNELAGKYTRLVDAQPLWNPLQHAWWHRPKIDDIADAYDEEYHNPLGYNRDLAVQSVAEYSLEMVAPMWGKLLEELEADGDH